ncbi:SagB/ThcOx family dehydrogenase [Ruegeria sp. 2012CJ41-6]|uniref:SagB/ThcOx family dehydrogenase n=1 Tax=Ruegeria spongiae TaxID=2942209 RepID=A0ABT0Q1L3_9RHOB|nr:SagB/ThcOx family dehydrogenase [Ruegeria spongiae]MCL6283715.1 SagB/ThcOx family dehydrogenase [Ruegeria spongiae]
MPDAIRPVQGLEAKPFLYARPVSDDMALNEPDAPVTAILHCSDLRQTVLSGQVLDLHGADGVTAIICGQLSALGFLQPTGTAAHISPTWEFHDRLLLSQIKKQDKINGFGASYRFGSDFEVAQSPLPAIDAIKLSEPSETGRLFSDVLQNRRSRRHVGMQPVTLERLANLLARAWREVQTADGFAGRLRPFPSGGAVHELELTILARTVDGLEPGAYRYCSRSNSLIPTEVKRQTIDRLCDQVGAAPGTSGEAVGCVLVISSQFPRLARVYEKIALKLTLMNSGAALQTLQLAATELGLNSWIIGAGMDFDVDGLLPETDEFQIAGVALGEAS